MGNSAAAQGSTDPYQSSDDSRFDGVETLGYRVLGVQPSSPASTAGLVSFFDFLVGANGIMLFNVEGQEGEEENVEKKTGDDEFFVDVDFPAFLKQNIDTEIELLVWNIKSKTQRVIQLTPSNNWNGTGLLGVTIRADDYAQAEDKLLRILDVEKNSPAAIAGLTPLTDYLLGTSTESFENEDILAEVLQKQVDKVFEVYVYNTETDVVRVVSIMPTLSWGGPGLLGCEVGRGYLHRLPTACRSTNGMSFERKIRMGARPTVKTLDSTDNGNAVVDADGVTCAISGKVVHVEPQIELATDSERKFVSLTEITVPQTNEGGEPAPSLNMDRISDLPPPPQLSGYDFYKTAVDSSTIVLPPLPHLDYE